jgi:hypothetical protein
MKTGCKRQLTWRLDAETTQKIASMVSTAHEKKRLADKRKGIEVEEWHDATGKPLSDADRKSAHRFIIELKLVAAPDVGSPIAEWPGQLWDLQEKSPDKSLNQLLIDLIKKAANSNTIEEWTPEGPRYHGGFEFGPNGERYFGGSLLAPETLHFIATELENAYFPKPPDTHKHVCDYSVTIRLAKKMLEKEGVPSGEAEEMLAEVLRVSSGALRQRLQRAPSGRAEKILDGVMGPFRHTPRQSRRATRK